MQVTLASKQRTPLGVDPVYRVEIMVVRVEARLETDHTKIRQDEMRIGD